MSHLIFITLMQLAGGSVSTAPQPMTPPAIEQPAPAAAPDTSSEARSQRVCSRVQGTNSRLSRRACYRPVSEEEVEQRQQNAQNWMREMQGPQNAIIPPDGGR